MGTTRHGVALMVSASLAALGMAAAGAGCASFEDDQCVGKCDEGGVHDQLAGKGDPVADYVRTISVDPNGIMTEDYESFLYGVADQMGCARDSVRTFILSDDLITRAEPFPRLISVACADDNARASSFFIVSAFEGKVPGEIDVHDVEMMAWDASALRYNFYAFQPAPGGASPDQVRLEVEPERCQVCHLTPTDVHPVAMHMTPVMNELNQPWTLWNAEPGFPSHNFVVPERVHTARTWREIAIANKGSASRLEEIMRFGGYQKVMEARLRERRDPAELDKAMSLLRPIFCEEQLNYASEDGDVIPAAVLVDPGIRNMYLQIRPDNWGWGWVNDQRNGVPIVRLAAGGGERLVQVPMRGTADTLIEDQLVARRVLTAHQVLQVKALDWHRPVFSAFRCDLWRDAHARFQSDPPDLSAAQRVSDAIPIVFDAIMQLGGRPLTSGREDEILVVGLADDETIGAVAGALGDRSRLADGVCSAEGTGFCLADELRLGSMIHQYVTEMTSSAPRAALLEERDRRICHLNEPVRPANGRFGHRPRVMNRPSLPRVSCP